jgi:putative heme-binding domain-containing protein
VRARFLPIASWHVIGPFPKSIPQIFAGRASIDFSQAHVGAGGQSVRWMTRRAEPVTGRVDLEDLKQGSGGQGGLGFEPGNSPELCAFAYAEVDSPSEGIALMLLGSSGTMIVTVNEKPVYQFGDGAGRAYGPDTDLIRFPLARGRNRILVVSRQGIGRWCFGIQVALSPSRPGPARPAPVTVTDLSQFALRHQGDPQRGEEIFFDPKGVGCAQCHSAGGRGTAVIGPDLTGLASKYDRAELIRSVLEPSSRIAPGYQPVIVATQSGNVVTGVVRAETEDHLELADSQARTTRIPKRDIALRRTGEISIMPVGSVGALSPIEFTDLISFLSSLKAVPAAVPQPEASKGRP